LVIATGGGCVTRQENYNLLHQNGRIFCLNRELSALPTDGRPLSQAVKLEEMYRTRKSLYDHFADHQIDNMDLNAAITQIQNILEGNA
jgi:shikimate dehydrogenase